MKDMLKLLIAAILLVSTAYGIRGCMRDVDSDLEQRRTAEKENRWKQPERKIPVTITMNKYTRQECIEAGGTFVIGDTKEFANALVGCIEKEK